MKERAREVDRLADNLKCRLQSLRDDIQIKIDQIIDIQIELRKEVIDDR